MSDTILRNRYGEVELISHAEPVQIETGLAGANPSQIADAYIRRNMGEMGLEQVALASDERALARVEKGEMAALTVAREKKIAGAVIVVYRQSLMGLEVFNARIGVRLDARERAVLGLQSSAHARIEIANPQARREGGANADENGERGKGGKGKGREIALKAADLRKRLGFSIPKMKNGRIARQVIYRYEPDARIEKSDDGGFGPEAILPDLPPLPKGTRPGAHYITDEILFEAPATEAGAMAHWRALVEPETGAVLFLRAHVAGATGMVYERDPQTQSGAAVTAASSNAALNPFRSSVTLEGLAAATPQPLSGEYVEITDLVNPTVAPPEGAGPAAAFDHDVTDDDFAAVNAYYHCDRLFRTMEEYGFDISNYFAGTSFPVPVDHRGEGGGRNAHCFGNASGDGIGSMTFGLLSMGDPVGIATSNRVVWHEFGHGLLWDHVSSPNFGFAHSAGDAMAAIFNDPGSAAPDRGLTFPWVDASSGFTRRHDRTVADGWAWFGPQYNAGYNGEQVLSSTLFRIYRSLGGDSSSLARQERAAELATYLIFKGCGLLTATSNLPEVFETAMEDADRTTLDFKGIPGGTLHKVVRWGFEKQGLFQPAAAPGQGNTVTSEGNPPDVDVYIDDGRGGEYEYLANHWSCQDMWVRHAPDGGLIHEQPLVGLTNYMYVRVKNRGLQDAQNVSVDAYHCLPGSGLSFPDDWMAMDTPTLPAAGPIPPGGETIVGPFAFVPSQVGHECLLAVASADDDPANDTTITGTVPEHRLVPFDNNIAQRNVHPVYPAFRWILEFLREHPLWIRNPFRWPVVCRIEIELPRFLRRLGWEMKVVSEGGGKFEIGARNKRRIVLTIEPGKEFTPRAARRAIAEGDHVIRVVSLLDGEPVGGMDYPLSFDAHPEPGYPHRDEEGRGEPCIPCSTIEEIIRMLRKRCKEAKSRPPCPPGKAHGPGRLRAGIRPDDET